MSFYVAPYKFIISLKNEMRQAFEKNTHRWKL